MHFIKLFNYCIPLRASNHGGILFASSYQNFEEEKKEEDLNSPFTKIQIQKHNRMRAKGLPVWYLADKIIIMEVACRFNKNTVESR